MSINAGSNSLRKMDSNWKSQSNISSPSSVENEHNCQTFTGTERTSSLVQMTVEAENHQESQSEDDCQYVSTAKQTNDSEPTKEIVHAGSNHFSSTAQSSANVQRRHESIPNESQQRGTPPNQTRKSEIDRNDSPPRSKHFLLSSVENTRDNEHRDTCQTDHSSAGGCTSKPEDGDFEHSPQISSTQGTLKNALNTQNNQFDDRSSSDTNTERTSSPVQIPVKAENYQESQSRDGCQHVSTAKQTNDSDPREKIGHAGSNRISSITQSSANVQSRSESIPNDCQQQGTPPNQTQESEIEGNDSPVRSKDFLSSPVENTSENKHRDTCQTDHYTAGVCKSKPEDGDFEHSPQISSTQGTLKNALNTQNNQSDDRNSSDTNTERTSSPVQIPVKAENCQESQSGDGCQHVSTAKQTNDSDPREKIGHAGPNPSPVRSKDFLSNPVENTSENKHRDTCQTDHSTAGVCKSKPEDNDSEHSAQISSTQGTLKKALNTQNNQSNDSSSSDTSTERTSSPVQMTVEAENHQERESEDSCQHVCKCIAKQTNDSEPREKIGHEDPNRISSTIPFPVNVQRRHESIPNDSQQQGTAPNQTRKSETDGTDSPAHSKDFSLSSVENTSKNEHSHTCQTDHSTAGVCKSKPEDSDFEHSAQISSTQGALKKALTTQNNQSNDRGSSDTNTERTSSPVQMTVEAENHQESQSGDGCQHVSTAKQTNDSDPREKIGHAGSNPSHVRSEDFLSGPVENTRENKHRDTCQTDHSSAGVCKSKPEDDDFEHSAQISSTQGTLKKALNTQNNQSDDRSSSDTNTERTFSPVQMTVNADNYQESQFGDGCQHVSTAKQTNDSDPREEIGHAGSNCISSTTQSSANVQSRPKSISSDSHQRGTPANQTQESETDGNDSFGHLKQSANTSHILWHDWKFWILIAIIILMQLISGLYIFSLKNIIVNSKYQASDLDSTQIAKDWLPLKELTDIEKKMVHLIEHRNKEESDFKSNVTKNLQDLQNKFDEIREKYEEMETWRRDFTQALDDVKSKLAAVAGRQKVFSDELNDTNIYIVGFLLAALIGIISSAYKFLIRRPNLGDNRIIEPVHRDIARVSSPDAIIETMKRKTMRKGILVISFCPSTQEFHSNMFNAVSESSSLPVKYSVIQHSNNLMDIDPHRLVIIFVDFNSRNIILENTENEAGYIREQTTEIFLNLECDVFVVYCKDTGSSGLQPNKLYNTRLYSIERHPVLYELKKKNRVLSIYDRFHPHQVEHLKHCCQQLFM